MRIRSRDNQRNSILNASRFYRNLSTPALLILTFLFFIPLIIVLSKAFVDENNIFSFSVFLTLLKDPYILRVISFTIMQAAISTIGALIIGLPGAYLLANYSFRGKRLIKAISSIPFILPSILVVLGFVIFYGNKGILNSFLVTLFKLESPPIQILYTFSAIILAHTFYNFPICSLDSLYVLGSYASSDSSGSGNSWSIKKKGVYYYYTPPSPACDYQCFGTCISFLFF